MQELSAVIPAGVEYSSGKELLNDVNKSHGEEGKGRRSTRGLATVGEHLRFLRNDLIRSQREWIVLTESETLGGPSNLGPPVNSRKRQSSGSPPAPARKKALSISTGKLSSSSPSDSYEEKQDSLPISPPSLGKAQGYRSSIKNPSTPTGSKIVPFRFDQPPPDNTYSATYGDSLSLSPSRLQPTTTDTIKYDTISDEAFLALLRKE